MKKYNSTCSNCGVEIYCPSCDSRRNYISKYVDEITREGLMKFQPKPMNKIRFKIVGLDRKSLFAADNDYIISYPKEKIVHGVKNSFGISCFRTLVGVKSFLNYCDDKLGGGGYGYEIGRKINNNEYTILLIKGIGQQHISAYDADTCCLHKFYNNHPVELYKNLFVNMREDDLDVRWTPDGTDWFDKIRVLT